MSTLGSFFKNLLWPLVVLGLGLYLVFSIREHLLDKNKVSAATNRANCEIELQKMEKNQFTICKDIFDSARR
jgi:hypothetical protein